MTAEAQQQPGEVNILHRSVGAFILIVLVLILLKGLLREQPVPAASVEDFAAAVELPVQNTGYQSTVQLGKTRRVLNSIRVPVKIGGNLNRGDSKLAAKKPANQQKPFAAVTGKSPAKVIAATKKTVKKRPAKVRMSIAQSGSEATQATRSKPITKTGKKLKSQKKQAKLASVKVVAHADIGQAGKRKSAASNTKKSLKAVAKASRKSAKTPRLSIAKPSIVKNNKSAVKIAKSRNSVSASPGRIASARVVARNKGNPRVGVKSSMPADWIVQIGLYSSNSNARRVRADLRKLGYPVVSMPMKTGKGIVTRLWVGPYKKRSSAALIRKKIIVLTRYKDSFIASNPLLRK